MSNEIESKLDQIKGRVLKILHNNHDARNNDLYLQWLYLTKYENIPMPRLTINEYVRLSSIMESIRRTRQRIQNTQKKYPPTELIIALKRRWAEEEWRRYFSP